MTLFSIDHNKNNVGTTIEKKLKNHRKQINVLSLQGSNKYWKDVRNPSDTSSKIDRGK